MTDTKDRSDSIHMQHELMKMASRKIHPPAYVTIEMEHMPFWNAIVDARAEWTNIDLIHAANLARTLYSIEEETKLLKEETSIVKNQRGTQIANPRFAVLETLSRRATSLSSKIQVHAAATIGEVENNKNRNKAKQNAINSINENQEDDLIARPPLQ